MEGFVGSNRTTGSSPPPIPADGRKSSVVLNQDSPPSSDRKIFDATNVLTVASNVFGEPGATARLAWTIFSGRPCRIWFQVLPPSVDLKMPPLVPFQVLFSQGPSRDSQRVAYATFESLGSIWTSPPPVFSSRLRTFSNVLPPSSERKIPRSSLGP